MEQLVWYAIVAAFPAILAIWFLLRWVNRGYSLVGGVLRGLACILGPAAGFLWYSIDRASAEIAACLATSGASAACERMVVWGDVVMVVSIVVSAFFLAGAVVIALVARPRRAEAQTDRLMIRRRGASS